MQAVDHRHGAVAWTKIGWWAIMLPAVVSGLWGLFLSVAYPGLGPHYDRMFAIAPIAFIHTAGGEPGSTPPSGSRHFALEVVGRGNSSRQLHKRV